MHSHIFFIIEMTRKLKYGENFSVECSYNNIVNDWILGVLIDIDPGLINDDLSSVNTIMMNFKAEDELLFPLVWFLSSVFMLVWKARTTRKPVRLERIKGELEADIAIMRKTKRMNEAYILDSAINLSSKIS